MGEISTVKWISEVITYWSYDPFIVYFILTSNSAEYKY